jgi:hypothetical protein
VCISSDVPKHEALFRTGMLVLVMAELARFIVQRQHLGSDFADGFTGLLFGLAIGLLLVAVVRRAHPRC